MGHLARIQYPVFTKTPFVSKNRQDIHLIHGAYKTEVPTHPKIRYKKELDYYEDVYSSSVDSNMNYTVIETEPFERGEKIYIEHLGEDYTINEVLKTDAGIFIYRINKEDVWTEKEVTEELEEELNQDIEWYYEFIAKIELKKEEIQEADMEEAHKQADKVTDGIKEKLKNLFTM